MAGGEYRNVLNSYECFGSPVIRLEQALRSGRILNAYLIEGDFSVDKDSFALAFAKAVLCPEAPGEGCGVCPVCRKIQDGNHEDVYLISPETKQGSGRASVRNEAVERLQAVLFTKPTAGDRNVAIISGADTMTGSAQNRLLKTLEEPPSDAVIMLLSENQEMLFPTIRSRTVRIRLSSDAASEVPEGFGSAASSEIVRGLRNGSMFYELCGILDGEVKTREDAMAFLDGIEKEFSEGIRNDTGEERKACAEGVNLTEEARRRLIRGGVPKYVTHSLILKLWNMRRSLNA